MRRWLPVAAGMAIVAGGIGCASIGRAVFKEPYVELRDVQVRGLGLDGGALDVVLAVYNPNDYALQTVKVTYNVFVDSTMLGTGETPNRYELTKGDTTLVRMPVDFKYAGVNRAVQQLFSRGAIKYRVSGELGVQTPIGTFTRPYDRVGQFSPRLR
jgi:LEA14-like dessication related protein